MKKILLYQRTNGKYNKVDGVKNRHTYEDKRVDNIKRFI